MSQSDDTSHFNVIVVGGGHAGIEAAYAAARLGSKTLLFSLKINKIGHMPCNPAVGGVGKGHIVHEISALGGLMPKLCTKSYLQARMLNTRKGPAVQGLRLQIDKQKYSTLSQEYLQTVKNLTIAEAEVETVLLKNDVVTGIRTADGTEYHAPSVVLTTGTFLRGLVHIGEKNYAAGRRDEQAVTGLALFLQSLGLHMERLKTGTPPRLLKSSIDFSVMEPQGSDKLNYLFEFAPHTVEHKIDCHITHTNERTHQIITDNMHRSPMYNGRITGKPPRYCPSVEDKVARFADKKSHHIFVEPEGAESDEMYPNGMSTSLPLDVQEQFIRSIAGFENAVIVRPGYAIEYDFVHPNQLHHSLELKKTRGLFLAGQINGTTGYEEAAGQGVMAGINAHQKAAGKEPFVLDRTESYIGVMIDDLVTMGVDEPYRMFTSRAERRLILRQDNVFARLGKKSFELGLIDQELYNAIEHENSLVEQTLRALRSSKGEQQLLQLFGSEECTPEKITDLIKKHALAQLSERAIQTVHAHVRYAPYLVREQREIARAQQYRDLKLPADIDFNTFEGLSVELRQKLNKYRPATIAQAALIPGMTPAAISLLIFKTQQKSKKAG